MSNDLYLTIREHLSYHTPTTLRIHNHAANQEQHNPEIPSRPRYASREEPRNIIAASIARESEHVGLLHCVQPQIESADFAARQNAVAPSFLSLPAEIRNQIYEDVFQGWIIAIRPDSRQKEGFETDIWPADTDPYQVLERRSWPVTTRSMSMLGLMYTCRQIHAETKHLPYGLSTVLYGDRVCSHEWMDVLHPQLYHTRTLRLCTYMPVNIVLSRVWLDIVRQFSDVKKIEIHWQLRMPAWGSEEDHLSTAASDEIDMRKRIVTATSAACEVTFHRAVVWD